MGKVETYKATPNGWDEKRSYLILKKVFGCFSNGRVNDRYMVVKRWSAQGYGSDGVFTDSLKGTEYTKNELQNLIKLNENQTTKKRTRLNQ